MKCRDIYLRIEGVSRYSPVDPEDHEHDRFRRDCMRNHGHEDARVPVAEVERRRLDALVYREYLDAGYTMPRVERLVSNDVNEPRWDRRVPGCVLYAEVGERLFVHVLNADTKPHSFHVHGLVYGIDSDGSWPFGVAGGTANGHDLRSDAICPDQSWCYVFDVTEDTIGAWPFHDHVMDIQAAADRGLFGGIVVRDPDCKPADIEVPFFLHRMVGTSVEPAFDSGTLTGGQVFTHPFPTAGTFDYVCRLHPMLGRVRVLPIGPMTATVAIVDSPTPRFVPDDLTIGEGGIVTWTNGGAMPHTVSDAASSPIDSYALNGRTFVGNTPTIVAESGCRIRWYVFNLDLGERWHNFHTHGQRFNVGHETADTRTIGPAESFVVDTVVPPVVLLPPGCDHDRHHHGCGCGIENDHDDHDDHDDHHDDSGGGSKPPSDKRPRKRRYCLQGDFLVHCHVEMHMMMGMTALVRAVQQVELTDETVARFGFNLPVAAPGCCELLCHDHDHDDHGHDDGAPDHHDHGGDSQHAGDSEHAGGHVAGTVAGNTGHGGHGSAPCGDCPDVHHHPCRPAAVGRWDRLPDLDIFTVHAAVLATGRVLLWSGTAEVGDPMVSRVWDPATDSRTAQSYTEDLFCSGHAWLPDGRLLVAGGAPSGSMDSTHIFTPSGTGGSWAKVNDMNQARWYPTVLTLPDGRVLAASGSGATGVEVFDGTNWTLVSGATRNFPELYPSLHQLPSGEIFYSRAGWAMADMGDTRSAYLSFAGPLTGSWTPLAQLQFHDRQEGTAVMQIDTTVSPPATRLFVIGGGVSGAATARNPQTVETIDLTSIGATTAWESPAGSMNFPRSNVNAVLLPDGTVFTVGGQRAGKWAADPQPVLDAEIFDPNASPATFTVTPPMAFPRQYHSIAVLLPDGRVLCAGGVDPSNPAERDQRSMEIFSPPYLDAGTRPIITAAPASATYGSIVGVNTSDPPGVASVVLVRPNSVTHHTDAGHRLIRLPIVATTAGGVDIRLPASGAIAPPGPYMLFIVDTDGIPSVARFITIN
jgi:plastocyanin